tara:strand:- start:186 stop:377 length:192 start_codon:yes stop_codon:yes gene_type:complete
MANITLQFNCDSGDGDYVDCYLNSDNNISICINDELDNLGMVFLDKSTAIKFAKTLRTEINKI